MTGVTLTIEVAGGAALARAFEAAPHIAREELFRAAFAGSLLAQRETQEETPVGVGGGGGLKGSILAREPEVREDAVIGVVGTPLNYALPVELGSKPHMPPVQPLVDWAEAKLGLSADEAKRVGFLIARKIARDGTEGAFMFKKGFERSEPQVRRMFERAMQRITDRIGGRA